MNLFSREKLFKLHVNHADKMSLEKDVIAPLAGTQSFYVYELKQDGKTNFWAQIKSARHSYPFSIV